MRKNLVSDFLTILVACVIVFIAVPIYMMAQSPEDFDFINVSSFVTSGLWFAITLCIFLSMVLAFLYFLRMHKIANSFSLFVITWVVLAGFILPVSVSTGMVEPEKNPVDALHLVIVLITAIAFSVFASGAFRKSIYLFLSIIVLGSVIPSLFTISKHLDLTSGEDHAEARADKKSEKFRDILSNKRNVLVISFDGLPGPIVSDILKTNDQISKEFKDFRFFDNVIAQAPVTKLSLMGEIYGVRNFKSTGKNHDSVFKGLKKAGLNDQLLTSEVADSYQIGYSFIDTKHLPISRNLDTYQEQQETVAFFRYPIVRIATSATLSLTIWEASEFRLKEYLKNSSINEKLPGFENHTGKTWDKKNIVEILHYSSWVDGLDVGNKDYSVRFLHFTFTHFPVDFDSNCKYKSDDADWHNRNQNEAGARAQTICALKLFSNLLNKLKHLNIYNNSLVVFKSDHGEPVYFYSQYPDNLLINGHYRFGYSRYRPTLMIKDFNADNVDITFNNDLVLLNDLANTLCTNSGLDIRCKHFPGVDLLSDNLESDEPYYIYVVSNSKSNTKFETYTSVKIPSRKMDFLEVLKNSPLISLSSPEE